MARVLRTREIRWAHLPEPYGRRPVCVLTRDAALGVLGRVTVAPITSVIRSIPSEVLVGSDEGLEIPCVISCDNVLTIDIRRLGDEAVGFLGVVKRRQLDRALRYALAIRG